MNNGNIINGIKWNYLGAVFKGIAQLGVLAAMARLLSPEEFGLMALALVIIKFGSYFSDFGLAAAIQQKKEINTSDVQASFWFSVLSGGLFSYLTWLISEPLSGFFDAPKLIPVIQLLSISFLVIGASSTSTGLLKRNMQFKYLSFAESASYLLGNGAVGIGLAYYGFGVYSLVWSYLAQILILLVLAYLKTKHSLGITLNRQDYAHVLRFGGGYSIASLMTYIAGNIDHALVGKFFSAAEVGLWNRSRNAILMPMYSLHISISRVLFPAYSKYQDNREKFVELYLQSLLVSGFVLIAIASGMYAAAPQIVAVLLGQKWEQAIPFVELSAVFVPAELLASFVATACTALGLLSTQIRLQLYLSLFAIPIMLMYSFKNDLWGVLETLAVYYWVRFLIYMLVIGKYLKIRIRQHAGILIRYLALALWVWVLINPVKFLFPNLPVLQLLVIQCALGIFAACSFIVVGPAKAIRTVIKRYVYCKPRVFKVAKLILKPGY